MNMGVSGSLSPDVANLTALTTLYSPDLFVILFVNIDEILTVVLYSLGRVLANNSLSGPIPSSLGKLKHLEVL